MITTNDSPRSPRRLRRRVAAGALLASALGLAAVVASSPAPAAPKQPATPKVASTRAASTRLASSVRPATTSSCPKSTYPTGPTSKTGYGVAFTAVLLDGALNAGYHETPAPAGDAYEPWGLHVGNLTGTVCGLIDLPSLNLSATPSDIQIGTDGQMSGPGELAPGQTGNFSFTGIADPGANQVGFNVSGYNYGGDGTSANVTATDGVAYYDTGHAQELSVSNIVLKSSNQPAGAPPGPSIPNGEQPAGGTFTLTNNSGQTVTDVQGEEPTGIIGNGPTTLTAKGKGSSGTYTWTAEGVLTGDQNIALSLRGETPTGPVTGFALAYYRVKITNGSPGGPLTLGNIMLNGVPASSAPGPALTPGSVFTTTFTVTNDSSTQAILLCNSTTGTCAGPDTDSSSDQFPSVMALLSVPGQNPYGYSPFVLYGFALSVDVPCTPGTSGADCPADLYTTPDGVCGASDLVPPNYCLPPNALSAKGVAAADANFSTVNPAINCDQDVSVNVTTARSTVVPKQVTGADRNLPVWTVEGQGLVGPLVGAEGEVVANDFGLTVTNDTGGCLPYDGEFDELAGGVTPPHSPLCKETGYLSGESYCYYNGANPSDIAYWQPNELNDPSSCLNPANHVSCGPPGEVQLSAEVVVTSIDLPSYNETAAARRG